MVDGIQSASIMKDIELQMLNGEAIVKMSSHKDEYPLTKVMEALRELKLETPTATVTLHGESIVHTIRLDLRGSEMVTEDELHAAITKLS